MLTSRGKGYDETTILNLGTLDSVELGLYIKQYCIRGGHN